MHALHRPAVHSYRTLAPCFAKKISTHQNKQILWYTGKYKAHFATTTSKVGDSVAPTGACSCACASTYGAKQTFHVRRCVLVTHAWSMRYVMTCTQREFVTSIALQRWTCKLPQGMCLLCPHLLAREGKLVSSSQIEYKSEVFCIAIDSTVVASAITSCVE